MSTGECTEPMNDEEASINKDSMTPAEEAEASEIKDGNDKSGEKQNKKEKNNNGKDTVDSNVKNDSKNKGNFNDNKDCTENNKNDTEVNEKKGNEQKKGSIEKTNEKDNSEIEESDSEEELGLLDRPVEVTGCRARKQVERLEVSFTLPTKDKQIPEGKGEKLGDCPRIEFQISKHGAGDLKPLHRVLFNRQGTMNDTKRNIRKFSGFPFQLDSSEFEQKKFKMEKITIAVLKQMCEVLDLERGGTKEDIIMRVLTFLLCPKHSGKALPTKKTSGAKKSAAKKNPKGGNKKSKAKESEVDDEEEASDPIDNEEKSEEIDDSDNKKNTKGKKKQTKVKTPKKGKSKEVKGLKRKIDVVSDSSDNSEPAAKKSKLPEDDEIKQLVKTILETSDLHEITMKKVIKQVYDTYPDCDLSDKRNLIKETIKTVYTRLNCFLDRIDTIFYCWRMTQER